MRVTEPATMSSPKDCASPGDILKLGPAGRYRLDREIGRSSFGVVWSATWLETGTTVAVKTVRHDKMQQAPAGLRYCWPDGLHREIGFLETLRAPHIVRFLRHGVVDRMPVLVLEQLDASVQQMISATPAAPRPVDLLTALHWLRQAASGLRVLHDAGWRHLDLKPSNLLLTPASESGRRLKLADFGAAVPVGQSSHDFAGTAGWLAPEQFFPTEWAATGFRYRSDLRADLYALGLLLFYFVTGHRTAGSEYAVGLHRRKPEQAAWAVRGETSSFALTASDRGAFLRALGGEAAILNEDDGTWHPALSGMATGRPDDSCGSRDTLALLEELLAVQPDHRPASASAALQRIEAVIRAVGRKPPAG